MVELRGVRVFKDGVRQGILQGNAVYLERELSGRDKRVIREFFEKDGQEIAFKRLGTIAAD